MAGGAGTRFWPASTPTRPKQLLPLAGDDPLILETLMRARGLVADERIRILTGKHLLNPFRECLGELAPDAYMVEPQARGTGPVLVWAAWAISRIDPEAVILSLHADHAIEPLNAFHRLMRSGARMAGASDSLFTVAVPPTRPETGYGYIQPGPEMAGEGGLDAFQVRSFVEKPDQATARRYVEAGYLWNSGIFLWQAALFLQEVRDVAPELGDLIHFLEEDDVEGFFREAPAISVDEAVLERSSRVASLKATFLWDDVGSWEALVRTRDADDAGNVRFGEVEAVDSRDNIAVAGDGTVVLFGVRDLVVVRSGNIVLVADRARTPDLKSLLEKLPSHLKDPDS